MTSRRALDGRANGPTSASDHESQLTRQALGVTLLGVLLNIGATAGFATAAPWWIRLCVGVGTSAVLTAAVVLLGRRTTVLRRLGRWIIRGETTP